MSAPEALESAAGTHPDTAFLRRVGSFYVDTREWSASSPLEKVLRLDGQKYFRFMDRIYSPAPIGQLAPDLVKEVCDLRLICGDVLVWSEIYEAVADEMARAIRASGAVAKKVVDFGCGDGRFMKQLAALLPGASLIGIDVSQLAVRMATAAGFRAVVSSSDLGMPTGCRSADLVTACFVFHFQIEEWSLRLLTRMVRPGGQVILNYYGQADSVERLIALGSLELTSVTDIESFAHHKVVTLTRPTS